VSAPRGRRRLLIALVLLGGLVAAPAGWLVSDHLEQDDEFCVSCHLSEEVPLHESKLADFRARPPRALFAAHAEAGNEAAADGAFRCIDCHGGTGFVGRARVKLLSAKDAFWYVVGRFDEPDHMRWPLWDADCKKCHDSFADTASPSEEDPYEDDAYEDDAYEQEEEGGALPFHALAEHNAELPVTCVECHLSHDPEGLPEHDFVVPQVVRAQCARCHVEFALAPSEVHLADGRPNQETPR